MCAGLTGLELPRQDSAVSASHLIGETAGVTGVCHHGWLVILEIWTQVLPLVEQTLYLLGHPPDSDLEISILLPLSL